jgi:hypothetical protein
MKQYKGIPMNKYTHTHTKGNMHSGTNELSNHLKDSPSVARLISTLENRKRSEGTMSE